MDVNPDYKDLLRILNSYHVRYLVIGAHALAFYTEPRYTKDLDVWIEPTPENAQHVLTALQEFGAPAGDLTLNDLTDPKMVYQIGVAPNRIDILTSISGVRFFTAWQNRVKTKYGDTPIHIISVKDFLRNKKAAGRPQDLLDLTLLQDAMNFLKPTPKKQRRSRGSSFRKSDLSSSFIGERFPSGPARRKQPLAARDDNYAIVVIKLVSDSSEYSRRYFLNGLKKI